MQLLEKSINEVGVIESISVTKEGTIISGHARKATFDKQGKKPKEVHLSDNEYPVIVRADIEDDTELYYKAQILANTTSKQNIDLDTELIEEIAVEYDLDIEELGVDVVEDTETHLSAEEDDFDTTPPEVPITVLGDLYEIGEHRLLCGDSTDSDQVAKLMNGNKAELLLTDPPYSSGGSQESGKTTGSIGARGGHTIKNDNLSTRGYRLLMQDVLALCSDVHSVFIFCDWKMWIETFDISERSGFRVRNMIVWDKMQMGMGMPFRNQHELCLFASKIAGKIGDGATPNVLQHKRDREAEHKTPKPIELLSDLLKQIESINVFDPFLGGGSTMVAAHQLKRKCYGMELDPKYCDVIVRRMIKLDPTLVIKRNGEVTNEFNETK
jgi:DNA modification methylase